MDYSILDKKKNKVTIILAEQGTPYEYPNYKFFGQSATFLQDFIEKEQNINKIDQIILREEDGRQFDANTKIEEYLNGEAPIYVFNRVFYRGDTQPSEYELLLSSTTLQKKWSESTYHFASAAYENIFGKDVGHYLDEDSNQRADYETLNGLFSDLKMSFPSLKEGSQKLKYQKNAGICAKKNTKNYYGEKKRNFEDKLRELDSKITSLEPYLNNFENTIEKLNSTPIDEFLKDGTKTTLIHYFTLNKIKNLKEYSMKNREKINLKSIEIKKEILEYDSSLIALDDNITSSYENIKEAIQDIEHTFSVELFEPHTSLFRSLIESSKGNVTKKEVAGFFTSQLKYLEPKISKLKEEVEHLKSRINEDWIENAKRLQGFIRDIAQIQLLIKDKFTNKLKGFGLLIDRYEKEMFAIKILEKFPETYSKSVTEMKRRSSFKNQYMTLLKMLEMFENTENEARKAFIEEHGEYLPDTFCPFLSRYFPHLNLEIIKHTLDADLSVSIKDSETSSKIESSEFLKLITGMHKTIDEKDGNLKDKDMRILNLEATIKELKAENSRIKEKGEGGEDKGLKFLSKYGSVFDECLKDNQKAFMSKTQQSLAKLQNKLNKVTGDYRKITDIVGTQVSAKKHYIQAKETELEAIKAEIKNSQVASSSELDTLSLQTKTLTKEKEEITAEFNKMKESLVSLEKVLSQEIAGFNTKEDGSNKLSQYLLQKKSEMETLAKDFAETKKKYKETAALVEKSHEIAGNSREMLTQKQATIDMLNAKIEAFSVEKFDLIKQIQELTKENQQIAKKNDDLSLSNSDLNRRLFQSNYSVPDESEEISTLQKRVDALEEELKLKKDSIKILEAEIVKIKTANNLLAEENKKLSNEAELKISALENKIKTLASRPVFSSEEVAALQSDNSNLKKSNASLQDEIMKYKNDQETMRTEIRALRKELESSVGLEKENTVVKSLLENIANELIHIYQGLEQSKEKLEESLKEPDPMTILDKISQLISIREIEFEKSFLNATPITFGEFQEHNTVVCLPTSRNHYFIPHRMEGINVIYVLGEEGKVTKRDPKEKYSIIVGKIKNLTVLENSFQFLNEYKITDMTTTVIAVDIEETVTIPGLG